MNDILHQNFYDFVEKSAKNLRANSIILPMSQSLYFDGKEYISSRRASEIASYSRDYVGQLARQGVISAKLVGRVWYVSKDDILRHALTYDLNHKKVSNVTQEEANKILASISSQPNQDESLKSDETLNIVESNKEQEVAKNSDLDFAQNGAKVMRNESESREDIHSSKNDAFLASRETAKTSPVSQKISSTGAPENAKSESDLISGDTGVKTLLNNYVKKEGIFSSKNEVKYETDTRPLLPELLSRDSAINMAISDESKSQKDEQFDSTSKSDEIRNIIENKKKLWAQKSKRFFDEKFASKLAKLGTKTTFGLASLMVAFVILVSASYLHNNFDLISNDFKSDLSSSSIAEYSASIGSFISNSWANIKVTSRDLICNVFGCENKNVALVRMSRDDSKTTIININNNSAKTNGTSSVVYQYPSDLSQISDIKNQIQILNDRLNNQKIFVANQSDRNMENVGKTASNLYDSIVTLIDQRLAGVSSGGTFSSDVTVGGILTVSGGSTSSFANSLSIGGQLALLGTGTSSIAGDVNFDSGVLYVDSLNNRIGIGTTSPLSVLDVFGNITLSQANSYLNFGPISGTNGYGFRDNAGVIEYKSIGGSWLPVGSGGGGGGTDGNWVYFNSSAIRLATSSNTVLIGANSTTTTSKLEVIGSTYISSNLGIGTTSPWRTLSVKGSSDLGNNALAGSFTATSSVSSVFPYASSTAYTISQNLYLSNLNGPLQANNGLVSATTSIGVNYGGTGVSSFGQGWVYSNGGTGALSASTSPTVAYIYASSTSATSTFAGAINVAGSTGFSVLQNGHVGIGTSTPVGNLYTPDLVTQAIAFSSGANITYQSGFNAYTDFSSGIAIASVPFATIKSNDNSKISLSNIGSIQSGDISVVSGGNFVLKNQYTTLSTPSNIRVADMNNDGKLDLVITNYVNDSISVFPGNGDGTFGTKVTTSSGTTNANISDLSIADIDGDGFKDVVLADTNISSTTIMINKGSFTFGSKANYNTGSLPYSVFTGDLNNDGKIDVVSANQSGNSVSVLINDGSGVMRSKVDYTTGSNPENLSLGDFNGDGKIDIVTTNYGANTMSILLNKGNGTFNTKVDYVTGAGPEGISAGDINGDNKPDIVVANAFYADSISVFINNGDGTFASKVDYSTATNSGPFKVILLI